MVFEVVVFAACFLISAWMQNSMNIDAKEIIADLVAPALLSVPIMMIYHPDLYGVVEHHILTVAITIVTVMTALILGTSEIAEEFYDSLVDTGLEVRRKEQ